MKKMKNMKSLSLKLGKVATYRRVGSPEQVRPTAAYAHCAALDNDELKRRTATTLAVAAAHGLTVETKNVIAEFGAGSDSAMRSGLEALLKQAENGEMGTLVISSLDRLARTSVEASRISDRLIKSGVTVVTSNQVFRLCQPEDAARLRLGFAPTEEAERITARGRSQARSRRG